MKKALIIGGASGLGIAVAKQYATRGFYPVIVDKAPGLGQHEELFGKGQYDYYSTNLEFFDSKLFDKLARDEQIKAVTITAGFGWICLFKELNLAEIELLIKVNSIAIIKLIRVFYERLATSEDMFFSVVTSVSAETTTPFYSVYSAAKASVSKCIESVNAELAGAGFTNKILNVSPGFFGGSSFFGGKTDTNALEDFVKNVVNKTFGREHMYITQPEEFLPLIDEYIADREAFGIKRYKYMVDLISQVPARKLCVGYYVLDFERYDLELVKKIKRAKEQCDFLVMGVRKFCKDKSGSQKCNEILALLASNRYIWEAEEYTDLNVATKKQGAKVIFVDKGSQLDKDMDLGDIKLVKI